jgi:hypothetical protein
VLSRFFRLSLPTSYTTRSLEFRRLKLQLRPIPEYRRAQSDEAVDDRHEQEWRTGELVEQETGGTTDDEDAETCTVNQARK